MIWKVNKHTHTCKYFLAILKKFYEILETLVKVPVKSAQAPANESVFAHHCIVYTFRLLLARFGLFFFITAKLRFISLVHSTHTHTFIRTQHLRTIEREREEKAITRTLTHMQTHILSHSRSLIRTHVRKFKR